MLNEFDKLKKQSAEILNSICETQEKSVSLKKS